MARTNILLVLAALQSLFVLQNGRSSAQKAVQLLEYDRANKFVLNPEGLKLIKSLPSPIQVISAIGDARVGKSTALNIVHHLWNKRSSDQFTQVFDTGGTFDAVTRGVWISVVHGKDGMARVMLDVEGTDLNDDNVTDHLSIFTALMSSGVTFFMRDQVKTHSIDFLFRVARLSDVIFKDETIKNYPPLRVVLRGSLETPPGMQLDDYVKRALVVPDWRDISDKKREAIARHFPRNKIEVSALEELADRKIFKDIGQLLRTDYMRSMEVLAANLKHFPVKKTVKGGLMDGETLAELAIKLVDTMANNNTWEDFGNVYLMVEKHVCDRRYEQIVKPHVSDDAQSLKHFLSSGFQKFEQECALAEYVSATKTELVRIVTTKELLEKKQRDLEIETNRRKAEQTKRANAEKQFAQDKATMNDELIKVQEQSNKIAEEAGKWKRQYDDKLNEIKRLNVQIAQAQERLESMQNSDGGIFGFISDLVDTVVKIAIPFKILGN